MGGALTCKGNKLKVLLKYRKQWLRLGSERTPGEGSTLPKVDSCQCSGCLGLGHSSPPLKSHRNALDDLDYQFRSFTSQNGRAVRSLFNNRSVTSNSGSDGTGEWDGGEGDWC